MFKDKVLIPGEAHLIHPSMGVVKTSDLLDRQRALATLGLSSTHIQPQAVDLLNQDLAAARESGVDAEAILHHLEEVKTRYCLDMYMLNPYIPPWPIECATVHDALAYLDYDWYMAKVDLKRMFNQLGIHPDDQPLLGTRIGNTIYISPRAQFGGAPFPALASTIMAEVARILRSHGINVVFLMDDLFICAATKSACANDLRNTIAILNRLGWIINYDKIEGPSRTLVFLGVLIDTRRCHISIPSDRMEVISLTIRAALDAHASSSLKFKDLESLVGRLNWCAEVLIAGRPRVKRIRDCLLEGRWSWSKPATRRFKPTISLSEEAITDLHWWLSTISSQASADELKWVPFWPKAPTISCRIFSDASGDGGFGVIINDTIYRGSWNSWTKEYSSGLKELIPILFALHQIGPLYTNHVLVFTTDNLGNTFALNKGSSRAKDSFDLIFQIFELAAQYNIYIVADWIPREWNMFSDCISKIFSFISN